MVRGQAGTLGACGGEDAGSTFVVPSRPPGGNGGCRGLLPGDAIRAPGEPGPARRLPAGPAQLSAAGEPQSLWAGAGGGRVEQTF